MAHTPNLLHPPGEVTRTSAAPDHAGRFAYGLLAGVEFSQGRDSFSQATPYVEFSCDTAWRRLAGVPKEPQEGYFGLALDNVHTWIDLSLQAAPVAATDLDTGQEFIDSRKTFQGLTGIDWRLLTFEDTDRREGGKVQRMRTFLGPTARIGLQTLDPATDDPMVAFEIDDRTARHWGIGLKMGDHPAEDRDSHYLNPAVRRFLAVYYGHYETFDDHKWTVEGMLQTDQDPGFFIGFTAVLGSGPDDITLWMGISLGFDKLGSLLRGLLPAGLVEDS
jgi:hypothetical protein